MTFFTTVPLCQMSEVKWRWDFLAHIVWSQSILSISGFFNKLYGRETGDELILYIQNCLKEIAGEHDGVEGYLGADNFGIFIPDSHEDY